MADLEARRRVRDNKKHVLLCENCPRRIGWWTRSGVHNIVQDHRQGWRWQGKTVPIRYRQVDQAGFNVFGWELVVTCPSCRWTRTYDSVEVMGWMMLDPRSPTTIAEARAAFLKVQKSEVGS